MNKSYSAKGAGALFAVALTYGFSGILVREISSMWGDKAQVTARFGLVLIFLLSYRLWTKNKISLDRSKIPIALVLGIATAGMVQFFTFAVQKTTVANTLFVFYAINMTSSFLLGSALLKEPVSRSKFVALLLALAGLALYSGAIVGGGFGILYSIVAGIFVGAVTIASKLLSNVNRNTVLIWQYAVVVLLTGIITLMSPDQIIRTVSAHGIILTVLFSLFIIMGSYLVLYGLQHFDANIGAVIMSTEIIFGAALAYALFGEVPKAHELFGGVLIFAGSVVGSGIFDKNRHSIEPLSQPD